MATSCTMKTAPFPHSITIEPLGHGHAARADVAVPGLGQLTMHDIMPKAELEVLLARVSELVQERLVEFAKTVK